MARPISSECLFIQREKITCHARRSPPMYVFQGRLWHAMPDIVGLGILSKGDDGMQRLTFDDRVRCPRAMMEFHA
uniref:Uncharacterized protein n=1 Tax=Solanum lycopersicum TaxID=4081 RepID=A0A3Q7JXN7_SOLLC